MKQGTPRVVLGLSDLAAHRGVEREIFDFGTAFQPLKREGDVPSA